MAGGRVVGSLEQSERFLWDVRRTLADLLVDNHLQYFQQLSHARGLQFSSESAGRQQFLYDPISFQVASDLPMGEFWASEKCPRPDCKAAASAGPSDQLADRRRRGLHFVRRPSGSIVPSRSRPWATAAFCFGVNRFVFHRMVLQPSPDRRPGLTWPNIGINFDPGQTWWEPAAAWIEYLTRCQYLLQQGRFVADAAVLTGEGLPNPVIRPLEQPVDPEGRTDASTLTEAMLRRFGQMPALPPAGYDYDGVNAADNTADDRAGRTARLSGGMSYRLLVLPRTSGMTLRGRQDSQNWCRRGPRSSARSPGSPSLAEYPQGDLRSRRSPKRSGATRRKAATTPRLRQRAGVLADGTGPPWRSGLAPDFQFAAGADTSKPWITSTAARRRRRYTSSRTSRRSADLRCRFRVSGRQPEIWLPDTGKSCVPGVCDSAGRALVPLRLPPCGSLFVVFRRPIAAGSRARPQAISPTLRPLHHRRSLDGTLRPAWGGPEQGDLSKSSTVGAGTPKPASATTPA